MKSFSGLWVGSLWQAAGMDAEQGKPDAGTADRVNESTERPTSAQKAESNPA